MGFGSAWRDIYRACHNIGATVGSQYAKIYGGIGSLTKAADGRHNGARRGIYSHKGRWRDVDAQGDDVCGVCDAWDCAVCVCVF